MLEACRKESSCKENAVHGVDCLGMKEGRQTRELAVSSICSMILLMLSMV